MDVSFDCELNLFANFEPTSFIEVATCDEWKEAMQNEYDAQMEPVSWLTLQLEPNQLVASGCTRTNTNQMAHLTSTK